MGEWPDNQTGLRGRPPDGTPHRPEFDRTVIRPAAAFPTNQAGAAADLEPAVVSRSRSKNTEKPGLRFWKFAGFALVFLALGAAAGGVTLMLRSGAISFSPPQETGGPEAHEIAAGPVADPATAAGSDPPFAAVVDPLPEDPDDLDSPADPFFDMALSAVIPLAGDPVLLRTADLQRRIDLSERPLVFASGGDDFGLSNAANAFVLDSQMLDANGSLIIRAPGTEADFQFGNFGGGQDTDSLELTEEPPESTEAALPVFLKPSTNTLNLYLAERPIGQGAHRIEIRETIRDSHTIAGYLAEHGFDREMAGDVEKFTASTYSKSDLIAGDKIAVRGIRLPNKIGRIGDYYRPVQVSLYSKDSYLGTAALSTQRDQPGYVAGADPWFGTSFAQHDMLKEAAAKDADEAEPVRSHRLIDGLYATAIRNAVPASIVGEAIAYLAPTTDLKRAVKAGERFTLLFTAQPRDEKRGGGRVLFAGVREGDNWSVRCYVLKAPGSPRFACVNEGGRVTVSGAMLVPVKGVLTSKFGMRFHPIKKTERLHAGVDWAAPTGTPIRAAFSGKVGYRDVRGGYGNFIELVHKDGITSRYAHMHEYGEGIELGTVVSAGDLIGYVGTTGLSTGPHLHFEIRQRGEPADPLAFEMETGAEVPQTVSSPALKGYRDFVQATLAAQ